ncbi:protein kinase domain-containing protein [Rhodococcus aetherivorans]|uniref:protein kinase domain-containing protein n=1 Tax=Rhodococcus aetherivorans TaxID=191292 RepID=UPI00388FBD1F
MTEQSPFDTQRDVTPTVAAELGAEGLEDAQEIGRGGFAVVYRCNQVALNRTVAVKVLVADLDDENRSRFLREQRALGQMTGHPNIVHVLEVGVTGSGRPYLVMPYHAQDSLDARIRRHGPLSVEQTLRLGVRMAGALESAHRLGVLHRDVKPANILLTDYGEPVLADFGIAHMADAFRTATGVVTGSPAFTAAEVLAGGPATAAADVYGLGATLFAALTGHAAFERRGGEQMVAQFLRISTEPVPDLRDQGLPEELCAVVEKAMSRDPAERPSAAMFGEELRALQVRYGFPLDEMAVPTDPHSGVDGPQPEQTPGSVPRPFRSGVKGNLPLELSSFVGRRAEMTGVKNRLSASRLVTLTGIGGVGKSRLALHVAGNMRREFPDGVWLIELERLHDPSLVAGVVADTLGLRVGSSGHISELLVDLLARRTLLLVFDNCEQLIDAVAQLVETLLRSCPHLRVLATSREALGVAGESVLPVPPLAVPDLSQAPSLRRLPRYDAVTLFAERAAAVAPGFELTDANRATVARICQSLDGLPLAIELAAARLRAMSCEQILQRLTDRYSLLTRGSRTAPARQQTLRMCVDWSYELCTRAERQVWAQAAVFTGGCELAAAEDVCRLEDGPDDVLDVLTALVDKSVLIRDEQGGMVRFRMLESVREYGWEKLIDSGEQQRVRRRHRNWCRRLVLEAEGEWISSRQLEWIARLDREQPNIRAALEFTLSHSDDADVAAGLQIAAALFPFWSCRGLFGEGRRWLGHALSRHCGETSTERAKALFVASVLAARQGDLAAGAALVDEAHVLAERTSDPVMRGWYAYADGMQAGYSGDLDRACRSLEEARTLLDTGTSVSQTTVHILQSLGWAYGLRGDTARATTCHERVFAITESRGETVYRSHSLWALGVVVWEQGDRRRAARLLEQALRLTRTVNDPFIASACLEALAGIAGDDQDARRAAVLMGAADEVRRSVGGVAVRTPPLLTRRAECERTVRRVLGERAFTAAYRKGSALGLDAAVSYAVGEHQRAVGSLAPGSSAGLTKREQQVAELVAEGLTNKAIAARLVISERTVHAHVEHVLAKLGFTSRTQIAAWVVERAAEEHSSTGGQGAEGLEA